MNDKIYFAGSIRGGRVDAALYQRLICYIKETDIVLTEHIGKMKMSLKAQTKAIDTHIYERDTEWLEVVIWLSLNVPVLLWALATNLHMRKLTTFPCTSSTTRASRTFQLCSTGIRILRSSRMKRKRKFTQNLIRY